MKLHYLLLFLIAPLLAGCQTSAFTYENPNDDPHRVPPKGSVVILNQPLQFRVGSSRSYVQYGVAQTGGVNSRNPYCMFYLYEPPEALKQERTIQPDQFTVIKSFQATSFASVKPIVQAAVILPSRDFADGPSAQTLTTTLRLKSELQPQVRELRCSVFGEANLYDFVSINQIIEALGDVATLQLSTAAQ
jgi:hypothetical protein